MVKDLPAHAGDTRDTYLSSIYLHTYFNSTFGTRKLVLNRVNALAFYCFSVPKRSGPVFESELHFTRE